MGNKTDIDYRLLYSVSDVVSNIVSLAFGLIIVGITVLLSVITACDLIYLNHPLVRAKVDEAFDGTHFGGIRLVSEDAKSSLNEAYSLNKSPMRVYLFKRMSTYFVAAVTLLILVGGGESLRVFATNVVLKALGAFGII